MNLVTGGTGLVGAHLLLELLRGGQPVRAIFRPGSNREIVRKIFSFWEKDGEALFNRIEWVEGDVLDVQSLQSAMEGCSAVYHCAATVSFHYRDVEQLMKVNVEGTANVVNACLSNGAVQLCHASSVAAIGRSNNGEQIDETTEWKNSVMNTNYAMSKRDSELELWRAAEEGLQVVSVNPGVVLGPCELGQSSSKLFHEVKKGLRFYSEGVTGFVDVRDVAEAMVGLMKTNSWGERYILVGENLSFREIFNLIADGFEKPRPTLELKPWLATLGAWMFWLKDLVFRTKSNITPESVRTVGKRFYYKNEKIEQALNRPMRPLAPNVQDSCRFFLLHD